MAKKKKENKLKLNKWMKILLWIVGTVLSIFLIFLIGFKVWVSTWQTYRNDELGFSMNIPRSWDFKNTTEKDVSSEQFVFDYGSILKLGDRNTDFEKDEKGDFTYNGYVLVYINLVPKESLDCLDGLTTSKTYVWGIQYHHCLNTNSSVYNFDVSIFDKNTNSIKSFIYGFVIPQLIISSFRLI